MTSRATRSTAAAHTAAKEAKVTKPKSASTNNKKRKRNEAPATKGGDSSDDAKDQSQEDEEPEVREPAKKKRTLLTPAECKEAYARLRELRSDVKELARVEQEKQTARYKAEVDVKRAEDALQAAEDEHDDAWVAHDNADYELDLLTNRFPRDELAALDASHAAAAELALERKREASRINAVARMKEIRRKAKTLFANEHVSATDKVMMFEKLVFWVAGDMPCKLPSLKASIEKSAEYKASLKFAMPADKMQSPAIWTGREVDDDHVVEELPAAAAAALNVFKMGRKALKACALKDVPADFADCMCLTYVEAFINQKLAEVDEVEPASE